MEKSAIKAAKPRDYSFDNIKAILILCVVLGHLLERIVRTVPAGLVFYNSIYLFHMPLFVFVSGYFSKKAAKSFTYSIKSALIPYIVFALIYKIVYCIVVRSSFNVSLNYLLNVPFALWYMLSLFYWRLLTPILAKIKFPIVMIILYAAGILTGIFVKSGSFLSVARAISFFPFYWLGFSLSPENIASIRSRSKLLWGVILAAIFGFALYFFVTVKDISFPRILQMKVTYEEAGTTPLTGALIRAALYAAVSVICICVIGLFPNRKSVLSHIGSNTLPVYILHVYVVYYGVRYFGLLDGILGSLSTPWKILFLLACAVVITVILSLPPFTTVINGINKLCGAFFGLIEKPFVKKRENKNEITEAK